MTVEMAQKREPTIEMKVPECITVPAAIAEVTRRVAKWVKAHDRPPAE